MHNRRSKIIKSAILLLIINVFPAMAQKQEKVLIAYFTWAENTIVIDREKAIKDANNHVFSVENSSSVDAVTTASVLPPGNTSRMAKWIQEITGGDLFSIRVKDKYSCYWDECLARASKEKARRLRPELTELVENISDYDVIFLGFPTWWYTIPMPVANFIESHDLSGKKIIPFVTHGTSGIAGTIRDLKKLLPSSATIEKETGIYRSEIRNGKPAIEKWLMQIGYTDQ